MADDTSRFSIPLVLPQASDIEDLVTQNEINYIIFALRELAVTLDNYTGALSPIKTDWPALLVGPMGLANPFKVYALCTTTIAFGMFVNLTGYSATRTQARPAVDTNGTTAAVGFCVTPGGVVAGQMGEFICGPGVNTGLTGLTPGTWYYISATAGLITAVVPSTVGKIKQRVGIAITDTILLVGSLNEWLQL